MTQTVERILEKWQPEPGSQLTQWIAEIEAAERELDQLTELRAQRIRQREAAMGRLAALHAWTEPTAIVQDRALIAAHDQVLPLIDAALHTTQKRLDRASGSIHSADRILTDTQAKVETAKAEAVKVPRLQSWVNTETALHEQRTSQFLRIPVSGGNKNAAGGAFD